MLGKLKSEMKSPPAQRDIQWRLQAVSGEPGVKPEINKMMGGEGEAPSLTIL